MLSVAGATAVAVAVVLSQAGTVEVPAPRAPAVPRDCLADLRAKGARFTDWPVRPTTLAHTGGARVLCAVPTGIALTRGVTGVRYQPQARVNCGFALSLARFEAVLQEEAQRTLHGRVTRITQLGTYNCRKMAAYPDLVSEHSFANAIDVSAFTLSNGRHVVVEQDWVPATQETSAPTALFLRRLTRRLYDEQIFSVVLTPSYDRHHHNHLHLDAAPYSVDGT